eukprot:CAMPEP_0194132580 /NCGR_PEP_ID=MMETSP0152-20130528/3013_1 /TAXON_ID=1049557 /ORGANISM="Thalassiothrix antarctica, Strain L6-D1" /LENGTH=427 /DNA_ID=CAMNT_0038827679 /DNA_START=80 /DNA_END=1363 /DNA_ORIENTATION=-
MKAVRWIGAAFLSSDIAIRSTSQINIFPMIVDHVIVSQSSTSNNFIPYSLTASPSISFIQNWLVEPAQAATPPSQKNIELLQQAMGTFYNQPPNYAKAQELLTQTIDIWEDQPVDELAALYRIRADCQMALLSPNQAREDYTKAIQLLQSSGGDKADPTELPTAFLGRARATRSISVLQLDEAFSLKAAKDYQISLRFSSREQWDTDRENEEDGAAHNPYAAWEWGTSLRNAGLYRQAAEVHTLAGQSFDDIGDRPRAVISQIDAGIDLAADASNSPDIKNNDETKSFLSKAIAQSKGVESQDIALLQRVIAKEGEGRMALASILWSNPQQRSGAEAELGEACSRLEQLQMDAIARNAKSINKGNGAEKGKLSAVATVTKLKFSIDDQPGSDIDCSRFKNKRFLSETLQWPAPLQDSVQKLVNLAQK